MYKWCRVSCNYNVVACTSEFCAQICQPWKQASGYCTVSHPSAPATWTYRRHSSSPWHIRFCECSRVWEKASCNLMHELWVMAGDIKSVFGLWTWLATVTFHSSLRLTGWSISVYTRFKVPIMFLKIRIFWDMSCVVRWVFPDVQKKIFKGLWTQFLWDLRTLEENIPVYQERVENWHNFTFTYTDITESWEGLGFDTSQGEKKFPLLRNVQTGSGGPPSLLFNGYMSYLPGIKRPYREVHHLYPSVSEVKNEWIYTSTPLIRIIRDVDTDNFNFSFTDTRIYVTVLTSKFTYKCK
jgi:hypothetical protein